MEKSEKSQGALARAKIVYFFKETFRYHSKDEYKEIFSRGLDDNGGINGGMPWLYVRAFFALFVLFTVNVLILRLTNNPLFVPSVTFLGGTTVTIPFIILLFELYPKRDVSLLMLMGVLVGGGTLAIALSQIGYGFVSVKNRWLSAVFTGILEEVCKIIPAICSILFFGQKGRYSCFLFAAAVGAGFSVIEDMGYIFYFSESHAPVFQSDVQAVVSIFTDRGLSSFCTHILWTGAAGWAYGASKKPFKSFWLLILLSSVALHILWDLPLEGMWQASVILACVVVASAIGIAMIHLSRREIITACVDLEFFDEEIIVQAKSMGEVLRFRNAANLTFSLAVTCLAVITLLLCALPIGTLYRTEVFGDSQSFINYIQGGYSFKADWDRAYAVGLPNYEERWRNEDGELELKYVIQAQSADIEGVQAEYYYGYGCYSTGYELETISLAVESLPVGNSRIECTQFKFGKETVWAFDIYENLISYVYNDDGSVSAVLNAEEFEGYDILIALSATACAVAACCTVILVAFTIKLRRIKEDEKK